jgi:hypothetical protein
MIGAPFLLASWNTVSEFRLHCSLLSEKIIYYLSFQNITFLINLMGELVYLLHNSVKQPPISSNY